MTDWVRRCRYLATEGVVSGQGKDQPARPGKANRLESLAKLVGILGGLIAVFTGIYQFGQNNIHNARELRWKQAMLG